MVEGRPVSRSIDITSVRGLAGLIARALRPIKLTYDRLNNAFSAVEAQQIRFAGS